MAAAVYVEAASGHNCWFLLFSVKKKKGKEGEKKKKKIFAIPLHINSIFSYVHKTRWAHWSKLPGRWIIDTVLCTTLSKSVFSIPAFFIFFNTLLHRNTLKFLLWSFFFLFLFFSHQHVSTICLGCMWYRVEIETTESYGWKSSSLRFTYLGSLPSAHCPDLSSDQRL